MDPVAIRLQNQRLTGAHCRTAPETVAWFGAVQAQEYLSARWAVGQRTAAATAADLDTALADGTIIRTHILRPTWHFVARDDLRWMMALSGPRVATATRGRQVQLRIDEAMVARSQAALADALRGGRFLTRNDLAPALEDAGVTIAGEGQRLPWLLMRAELDAVICSGPLRGKQFTYALIDDRIPPSPPLSREAALGRLARRYFQSHGPATIRDFAWWSGLTRTDCRAAIAHAGDAISETTVGETAAWLPNDSPAPEPSASDVHLLPAFDEYTVAYADRSAVFDPAHAHHFDARGNVLNAVILIGGQVAGTWKRTPGNTKVDIQARLFEPLTAHHRAALEAEAQRYATFHGLEQANLAIAD